MMNWKSSETIHYYDSQTVLLLVPQGSGSKGPSLLKSLAVDHPVNIHTFFSNLKLRFAEMSMIFTCEMIEPVRHHLRLTWQDVGSIERFDVSLLDNGDVGC